MLAETSSVLESGCRAEVLFRDLISRQVRILGEGSAEVAQTRNNLAGVLESNLEYEEAAGLYRQALSTYARTHGRRSNEYGVCLNNLAQAYYRMARLDESEATYREAVEVLEAAENAEPAAATWPLQGLAMVLSKQGRESEAGRLWQQVLEKRTEALDPTHDAIADARKQLADHHLRTGRYASAVALLRQALGSLRSIFGPAHSDAIGVAKELANLYLTLNDVGRARELLEGCLELLTADLPQQRLFKALLQNQLSDAYQRAGQLDDALRALEEVLKSSCTLFGEKHPNTATVHQNLAALYYKTGRFADAGEQLSLAEGILEARLAPDHPRFVSLWNAQALLKLAEGLPREAEQLFVQCRDAVEGTQGKNNLRQMVVLQSLARCRAAQGDLSGATSFAWQAVDQGDRILQDVFTFATDSRRIHFLQLLGLQTRIVASLALSGAPATPGPRETLRYVLRRKAISTETAQAQFFESLKEGMPEIREGLSRLAFLRARLAETAPFGSRPGDETGVEEGTRRIAEERRALEEELVARCPAIGLPGRLLQVEPDDVFEALPSGAALVELVRVRPLGFHGVRSGSGTPRTEDHYVAWTMVPSATGLSVHLDDLGGAREIDALLSEYRRAIGRREPHEVLREVGSRLRSRIFDPISDRLGAIDRLILCPDSRLALLPWETLPTDSGRFLIDDIHLSYLMVGREALSFRETGQRPASGPLVIAAPDFYAVIEEGGEEPFGRWERDVALERGMLPLSPLLGAAIEGRQVAEILGTEAITGGRAVRSRILEARAPSILHLATHGFFLGDSLESAEEDPIDPGRPQPSLNSLDRAMLRSGLVFAGAGSWLGGGTCTSGFVTALDILGVDLHGTQLVVLSACETALGSASQAEGVFGLRRAFSIAGAQTLVMSLWRVDDIACREAHGFLLPPADGGGGPERCPQEGPARPSQVLAPSSRLGRLHLPGQPLRALDTTLTPSGGSAVRNSPITRLFDD